MVNHNVDDYTIDNEDDEYLTKVVIDTCKRTFYIYSSEGSDKTVECETVDQFMDLLDLIRGVVDDDMVIYLDPLVTSKLLTKSRVVFTKATANFPK